MIFRSSLRLCCLVIFSFLALSRLVAVPSAPAWAAGPVESAPPQILWAVSPNGKYFSAHDWHGGAIRIFKGSDLVHIKTHKPRRSGNTHLVVAKAEVDDRGEVSALIYQINADTIAFYQYDSSDGSLTFLNQAESPHWSYHNNLYYRETDLLRIFWNETNEMCFFDALTGELIGVDPKPTSMDGPFVQRRDHRVYLEDYRDPGPFLVQGKSTATVSEFLPAEHLPDGAVFWSVAHNSGGYIGALYELSGDLRFRVWLLSNSGVYEQQYDVPSDLELQPQFDPILYPNYTTDSGLLLVALDDTDVADPVIPTQNYELWSAEIPIHFDLDLSLHILRNLFPFINDYDFKPLDEQFLAIGYHADEEGNTNFVDIFDRQTGELVLRINGAVTATFSTEEPKRIATYMRDEQVILRDFPSGAPIANLGQFDYSYNGYSIDNLEVGLAPLGERPSLRIRRVNNNDVTVFNIQDPLRQYVEKPAKPLFHLTGMPPRVDASQDIHYVDEPNQRYYYFDGVNTFYWNLTTGRGPISFPTRNAQAGDEYAQPLTGPALHADIPWVRLSADISAMIEMDFGAQGKFLDAWPAANAWITIKLDHSQGHTYYVIDDNDFSELAHFADEVAVSGDYLMTSANNSGVLGLSTYDTELQLVDTIPDLRAHLETLGAGLSSVHGVFRGNITRRNQFYCVYRKTDGDYNLAIFSTNTSSGELYVQHDIPLDVSSANLDVSHVEESIYGEDFSRVYLRDNDSRYHSCLINSKTGELLFQTPGYHLLPVSDDGQTLWLQNGNMEQHDLSGNNPPIIGGPAPMGDIIDANLGTYFETSISNHGFPLRILQAPEMSILATMHDGFNDDWPSDRPFAPAYVNGELRYYIVQQLPGEFSIYDPWNISLYSDDAPSPAQWLAEKNLPAGADLENDTGPSGVQPLTFDYLTGEPNLGATAIAQLAEGGDWLYRVRNQPNGWSLQAKVSDNLVEWTPLSLPTLYQDDTYIYFEAPEGFGDAFRFIQFTSEAPPAP